MISWALLVAPSRAAGVATAVKVALVPASVPADGVSTATATATVTDVLNAGVPGETVVFTSSDPAEKIGAVTADGKGNYSATIASSTTVGSPTITATDTSAVVKISGQATLAQTTGPAASVLVQLSPSTIVANGTSTSKATATVTDAQGHPLVGQLGVAFSHSDPGETIGAVTDHGNGKYTATVRSSTKVGPSTITATDGLVAGSATLTQAAGPPSSVTVELSPSSIAANGASTSTATATVTDAQGHPVAVGNVSFSASDGGIHFSGTTNNGNGTYSATLTSSKSVGSSIITATDTSVTPRISGQATLTQTGGQATSVTVQLSPPVILGNGFAATRATATVNDAQGHALAGETVGFFSSDPGESISPVTNNGNGTYTATITSSTTAGQVTITAVDGSTSPAVAGQSSLTQTANSSTTSLLSTPSTAVTNQSVILIATVTSSSSAAPPSGVVTFERGGVPIRGCSLPASTANQSLTIPCTTSFTASTSPEQLTAVFTPRSGSSVAGSTSATDSLVVKQDSSSTTLQVSNPTVNLGTSATYTATVTPGHAGPFPPSGSVVFLDGGKQISSCGSRPLTNTRAFFTASCKVTYNTTGTHHITALYRGDASFRGSGSSPSESVSVRRLPVQVAGTITSTMQWTFYFTPSYTKVVALIVNGAPVGATVVITCHGRSCPFPTRTIPIAKGKPCKATSKHRCAPQHPGTVDLMPHFHSRRLARGVQITVEIERAHWIGKYYSFTVRPRHGPQVLIDCVGPATNRPGVGC